MTNIDEQILAAVARYRQLFPEPLVLDDPSDWLADGLRWLKEYAAPLANTLVDNLRFQYVAKQVLRDLAPGAPTPERTAMESVQRRQTAVAEEIRRLASSDKYKQRLDSELCTFGGTASAISPDQAKDELRMQPLWSISRLDVLIEECRGELFHADSFFVGGDNHEGVILNPQHSPYVSPVVRSLVDCVDRRRETLFELSSAVGLMSHGDEEWECLDEGLNDLQNAWGREQLSITALHDALGVGERRRSIDAHTTVVLLFAAFCGTAEFDAGLPRLFEDAVVRLKWLGLTDEIVRDGANHCRSRLAGRLGYELERLRTHFPLLTEMPTDAEIKQLTAEEAELIVYGRKGPIRYKGAEVELPPKMRLLLCWLATRMKENRGTTPVDHTDYAKWTGEEIKKGTLKTAVSRLRQRLSKKSETQELAEAIPEGKADMGYKLSLKASEISVIPD